MDPYWKSPSFRGGRGNPRNPRYRGEGGGGFGTPRGFSPQWQQRSPSPYHHHQRFQSGSHFSPQQQQLRSPYDAPFFVTSTPIQGSGGGRPPFFRGGRGGRFNKRQSFDRNTQGDNIENWISPEMWSDPWSHLITSNPANETTNLTGDDNDDSSTKFADSDFNVTDSLGIETRSESEDQQQELDLDNVRAIETFSTDFNSTPAHFRMTIRRQYT